MSPTRSAAATHITSAEADTATDFINTTTATKQATEREGKQANQGKNEGAGEKEGGQGGAIAGGVVGTVVVGCLVGLAVFLYTRRAGAPPQDEGGDRNDAGGEVVLGPGEQPPDQRKHYNRAPEYVPQLAAMLAAVRPARAT